MNKVNFSVITLMLGTLTIMLATSNSFASINFYQLSVYDSDQHYTTSGIYPDDFDDANPAKAKPDQLTIGALKRGADNVPILKVVVKGEAGGTTLYSLTVVYTGPRLGDIGRYARMYEANYHKKTYPPKLESAVLIREDFIGSGEVTFYLLPSRIPAGEMKTCIIVLDITSDARSNKVDLRVKAVNGYPKTGYIFDLEVGEEPDVIVDVDSIMDLRGASVSEGYGRYVTIRLTPEQRDILKEDHPQLYLAEGAVKDVAGVAIVAFNADGVDNDGDGLIDEGGIEYIEGYGDDDIDAANVYVTPPLLSGGESVYYGNLIYFPEFGDPDQDKSYKAVLELKFTEDIGEVDDVTKITVTNEKDEQPFTLTLAEYDSILWFEDVRVVRFFLTRGNPNYHKATISYWQRKDSGIDELHIKLDRGAVRDVNGNYNELMEVSERIVWIKDTEGPRVTDSSSYSHSSNLLKLKFNEVLDLTSKDGSVSDLLILKYLTQRR